MTYIEFQMSLAVAECIVQGRMVSWIALSNGQPIFAPYRDPRLGYWY